MDLADISVSIVVYRSNPKILEATLDSLSKSNLPLKVLVVDNSPTNELESLVRSYAFSYLFQNQNAGFSRAHNVGIRHFWNQSKYHIVLNPDVSFEADTIEKLARFMDQNSDVGIATPKIFYPDGSIQRHCRLLPSPFDLFLRRFLPGENLRRRHDFKYEMHFADYDQTMDVPCLPGSFMFLRVEALKKCGLFDENFFLYLEDYELCHRIGQSYRLVHFAGVSMIHHYMRESYKNRKLLWIHVKSAFYYFSKTGWLWDGVRSMRNRQILKQLNFKSDDRPPA